MDKENLLESIFAAATAVGAAETVLRLKRRNEAKARFQRERWTVEKTWERFDLLSGYIHAYLVRDSFVGAFLNGRRYPRVEGGC